MAASAASGAQSGRAKGACPCSVCGKPFARTHPKQRTCSDECMLRSVSSRKSPHSLQSFYILIEGCMANGFFP
jgi:hypothetical protein